MGRLKQRKAENDLKVFILIIIRSVTNLLTSLLYKVQPENGGESCRYGDIIKEVSAQGKILSLDDQLQGSEACGCKPLNGLLHLARQKQLHINQLMLLNSGDTAGPRDRVVGYGAFVINNTP
jgi:predicted class III extradiol MEMO1 family dioxygenase